MKKIPKREYTAEFKEQVVKRVKNGKSVGAVAKEMGLVEQTLCNWVKRFDAGRLNGAGAAKVTPEQMELLGTTDLPIDGAQRRRRRAALACARVFHGMRKVLASH